MGGNATIMTMTTLHWVLWLSLLASHLRLASLGNVTTTSAEVMPSSNYTDFVDVTSLSGDVTGGVVPQDDRTTATSIPSASMKTSLGLRNGTNDQSTTLEITTADDLQTTESYLRMLNENLRENGTSRNQTDETVTVKSATVKSFLSVDPSSDSTESTASTLEETSSILSSTNASYSATSFTKTSTETLQEPAFTSKPARFYTHFATTNVPATKKIKDGLPTSPVSQVSKTSFNLTGPIIKAITNVTSSSTVPNVMTSHYSGTAHHSEASVTTVPPTFEVSKQNEVSESIAGTDYLRTTPPMAQPPTSDFLAGKAKTTQSTPFTQQVTEEVTTLTGDDDDIEEDEQETDGESSHVETAYERSLRTRRVINHAALWITIGFVVVLVTYITVLVIYNRTRPDWQDPQRPYSRFENEPEDFQDLNENNVDCESQGLIEEHQQHENRRDFSQCVDPRDFPPCEGSNEYLLYEDPTYMDDDTCSDFTYRDQ